MSKPKKPPPPPTTEPAPDYGAGNVKGGESMATDLIFLMTRQQFVQANCLALLYRLVADDVAIDTRQRLEAKAMLPNLIRQSGQLNQAISGKLQAIAEAGRPAIELPQRH